MNSSAFNDMICKEKPKKTKDEKKGRDITWQNTESSDLFSPYPVFLCCLALTGSDNINK